MDAYEQLSPGLGTLLLDHVVISASHGIGDVIQQAGAKYDIVRPKVLKVPDVPCNKPGAAYPECAHQELRLLDVPPTKVHSEDIAKSALGQLKRLHPAMRTHVDDR
jgi:hypothetical protein